MRDIHTERLTLRPLNEGDLADVLPLAAEFRVARMLSDMPHPATPANIADWLKHRQGEQRWAILLEGRFIGSIGYFHTAWGRAEVGYWLGPAWWGRGYALEAAVPVIERGRDSEAVDCFTASYFIDNPASGKILHCLGFRATGRRGIFCPARGGTVDAMMCELPVAAPASRRTPLAWLPRTVRRALATFAR
jgi:RimJ/RimL family protein N-acetyltransferase